MNFLGDLHARGLQFATINVYRSAISAAHKGFEGTPSGQHPRVVSLMKGVFNDRPPKPRYSSTWDVGIVLQKLKKWGDNTQLTMKQLSYKLAILIAITTACRGSELKAMNPEFMMDRGSMVEFPLAALTKGKRPTKPHLSITLTEFEEDPILDVVACLHVYLKATADWRISQVHLNCS